jgi:hypothetical protein
MEANLVKLKRRKFFASTARMKDAKIQNVE